jgi:hypothetical protein
MSDILVANLLGEVEDMEMARDPLYRAAHDVTKMDDLRKVKRTLEDASHCSALIRLAPDGTDVFSAHTTWTGFANMLRIYKYYGAFTATGNAIQFSSFPGCVSSIDDYYQTSANMVVIETTNNIANMSLYDLVTPESVPTFVRVMVANALTTSGQDWAEMYALQNSGTYNNRQST